MATNDGYVSDSRLLRLGTNSLRLSKLIDGEDDIHHGSELRICYSLLSRAIALSIDLDGFRGLLGRALVLRLIGSRRHGGKAAAAKSGPQLDS